MLLLQLNPSVLSAPFLLASLFIPPLHPLASLFSSPARRGIFFPRVAFAASLVVSHPLPTISASSLPFSILFSLSPSLPFYFFLLLLLLFFFVPRSSVSLERCAFACFFSAPRLSHTISLSLSRSCCSLAVHVSAVLASRCLFPSLSLSLLLAPSLSRRMKYFARAHLFASAPAVGRALLYYEFRSLARSARIASEPAAH